MQEFGAPVAAGLAQLRHHLTVVFRGAVDVETIGAQEPRIHGRLIFAHVVFGHSRRQLPKTNISPRFLLDPVNPEGRFAMCRPQGRFGDQGPVGLVMGPFRGFWMREFRQQCMILRAVAGVIQQHYPPISISPRLHEVEPALPFGCQRRREPARDRQRRFDRRQPLQKILKPCRDSAPEIRKKQSGPLVDFLLNPVKCLRWKIRKIEVCDYNQVERSFQRPVQRFIGGLVCIRPGSRVD